MMPKTRRGQIRHWMLFLLIPLVLIDGLMLIHAIGKADDKAYAPTPVSVQRVCVMDDYQKLSLVILGAFAGSTIGLIFRIEADNEFAKRNILRRLSYMIVALLVSACGTPYLLMRISEDQPKALCLIMGMFNAAFGWLILEIFYGKAKGYLTTFFDRIMPVPKEPIHVVSKEPVYTAEKDKAPPSC